MKRTWAVAAIIALIVGFGGGFLAAKGLDNGMFKHAATAIAQGQPWSMFGKPRAADAPRRGIPKPEGFTVWKSRLDTAGAQPLACIEMTRALDANKSYGDYVLVSPDLGHPAAVNVKGDEICVGGVGFTDRRITLLKGLPSGSGETIAGSGSGTSCCRCCSTAGALPS